ncbi:GNAT family N-acetyltransferase [Clavibacter phaseoli]|uniref:GNAT family N-acetyltransferase n=1 Tax=Clavibacter phaseoli TaxID=1734031 RepID=UPI000E666780|nr:GNAT family N-acetyltransferase [Clavibacter phaseoli]RIJ60173.1 N-acetyltransferase [Clavibacter phaseoli]
MPIEVTSRRSGPDVRRILEALPDWFGDPAAIDAYVAASESDGYDGLLAVEGATVIGVALLRRHFPESAELHLIAVAPDARGRGVGRLLVEHAADALATSGCALLSVHTVGPSFEHEPYAQTRGFYRRLGFLPLEEHPGLDWSGPTLILVRPIRQPA